MWDKLQIGITILIALLLLLACLGVIFLYSSHKGLISTNNPIIGLLIFSLAPLSVIILGCLIFSSGLLIASIGKYLFGGQISGISKRLFFIHSIYEFSYLIFYLWFFFFNLE